MPKRKTPSTDSALHVATREDGFAIDPDLALEASDSEESCYSGLESEPDTEEEEEEVLRDSAGSPSTGSEVSSDEDEVEGEGQESVPRDPWKEAEDADTSDEEEYRNTVGNIPLHWYDDLPHIGYSLDGKQILRPAKGDELDEFLSKMDNPDYWRTVQDKLSGREVVLSDQELNIIQRIQNAEFPSLAGSNPYEDYVDHFTKEKALHPLSSVPPPKSSFEPSKWERQRIGKLVHAIKMGWIKPHKSSKAERPRFYMIWGDSEQADRGKSRMHIPAPKVKLPGHAESYNPPPEYLPTEDEAREWEESEPEDRKLNFLPHKYGSLRQVPAYPRFLQERFERCLDLYLCPRQRKMRVQIDPEDLIPKLPKPKDLQPFPTTESIVFEGHSALVRSISVDHSGQWLASGSADGSVRLWEVATGRCVETLPLPAEGGGVVGVAFAPSSSLSLLAVAVGSKVLVVNHGCADRLVVSATLSALSNFQQAAASLPSDSSALWEPFCLKDDVKGVSIQHSKPVKQVCWHSRGDYMASVVEDASGSGVLVHQLSKWRSQAPFKKMKGAVQKVLFHPSRPFFFVATQTTVRVYNLAKQELTRKLQTGVRWISSMDIHSQGDNLILGSFDKRLCWFDMDLSSKPYRVMRHHRQAIRSVCYHPRYPLFASCSDDASVIVCHGRIFSDLMQNPLIVPVKVLKGHAIVDSLGVLDCKFHPLQPWIFTAGADKTIRLFT